MAARLLRRVAATGLAALAAAAQAAPGADGPGWRNVTAGGTLRHGVYGRIEFKEAPPPVIYPAPTVVEGLPAASGARPLYLYVPPGQVRKWRQHCVRWDACGQPVLFVRMDNSPSRLGEWKQRPNTSVMGAGRAD